MSACLGEVRFCAAEPTSFGWGWGCDPRRGEALLHRPRTHGGGVAGGLRGKEQIQAGLVSINHQTRNKTRV